MSSYTPDMEYFEDMRYQEFLLTSKRKAICPPHKILNEFDLKDAQNVVDFGMGLGFYIPYLQSKMNKDAWLWGVECQQDLIDLVLKKRVEQNIKNFSVVFLERTEHPLLPQWVPVPEYIFASLSISTFANPGLAMDGLVRSMKPNGKLIIVDWSKTEYPIGPNIKEKVSLDKMKYLAELYNLEILKTFIVSEFFYGLIVQAGPNFERKNYYYRE